MTLSALLQANFGGKMWNRTTPVSGPVLQTFCSDQLLNLPICGSPSTYRPWPTRFNRPARSLARVMGNIGEPGRDRTDVCGLRGRC